MSSLEMSDLNPFQHPGFDILLEAKLKQYDRNSDGSFVFNTGEVIDMLDDAEIITRTRFKITDEEFKIMETAAGDYAHKLYMLQEANYGY